MHFYADERLVVFIDGANLYGAARSLDFDIDYKRLLGVFRAEAVVVRAYYYTALVEDQEFSSLRPLIDWLDYNGYAVVTKPVKEFTDVNGRKRFKGSMDVEIAVDAMEIAEHADHILIFSGDGDLRSLVAALQRKGKTVTVCSTTRTNPPLIADELRRQADHFLELDTLKNKIGRDPSERPQRTTNEEDEFVDT
ncbi:MAG: NYN domain-containing protein [Pseudomonadota bacterium]